MAIPNRIIEGIYSHELQAENYYSVYEKENIEKALQEIGKSNIEILNKYSPEDMKKAVARKMGLSRFPIRSGMTNTRKVYSFLSYAAAAVFIAAIAIPVGLNSYKAKTPTSTQRLKGPTLEVQDASLNLYRQKGKEIHALHSGDFANFGDILQITYQAGKGEYGIIFSVDGNGNITRHFPENSWTAGKLKHGNEEVPLDFSYELDNAPDYEYFIMVTSANQFSLENIENKIKDGKNLDYLKKHNFLPKNTEVKSFLIEK